MRSVVVVLPASMWAMIPMLRVLSRGNLRGICLVSGGRLVWKVGQRESVWCRRDSQARCRRCVGSGQKNGPLGPTRCRSSGGSLLYLLKVSMLVSARLEHAQATAPVSPADGDYSRGDGA